MTSPSEPHSDEARVGQRGYTKPGPSQLIGSRALLYPLAAFLAALGGMEIANLALSDGRGVLDSTERWSLAAIFLIIINARHSIYQGKLQKLRDLQFAGCHYWNMRETLIHGAFAGIAVGLLPTFGYILIMPYAMLYGPSVMPAWMVEASLLIFLSPLAAAGLVVPGAIMADPGDV